MKSNHSINCKFYFFTDKITDLIKINILKFNNISIIYKNNAKNIDLKNLLDIKKFCRNNLIKFYVADNYKLAIKFKANGLFVSANNKNYIPYYEKRGEFELIGAAHNQNEYFFKTKQKINRIFLSPIFINNKYSENKILGLARFNILSLNWKNTVYALGGINLNNIKRVFLTKSAGIGFVSLIYNPKIKKPVYFLSRRVFN